MSFKKQISKLLSYPLLGLVYFYKYSISPLTPASCRHVPTCSNYMIDAVKTHGLKGFWMGLKRLSKCHPWGTHGYDPVPPKNYIKIKKMNAKKFKKKN
ncbi:MAG TPA: membrane protein insertion efficiency factor YidD [Prolixibacteraceae bacterium]|nr:membrane protein insertion efficiency factor YidD [Prolixibacteraceae bacterium]